MSDIDTTIAGTMADGHSRVSQSRAGRLILVPFLAVLAGWLVLPNMPDSPLRNSVEPLWWPADQVGLHQSWSVFSPNPRGLSVEVAARIEYADGSTEMWEMPAFDPALGAYRNYRWNKWQDRIRLDDYELHREPAALWLANEHRRNGELPVSITLIERTRTHKPLGSAKPLDGEWEEDEFYTWELDR